MSIMEYYFDLERTDFKVEEDFCSYMRNRAKNFKIKMPSVGQQISKN